MTTRKRTRSIIENIVEPEQPAEESKKEAKVIPLNESPENTLKEAQNPEEIHTEIREKLSTRNLKEQDDPFNPGVSQAVTKAKVETLAESKGFALNRGTEIGARLMARSKKNL